MSNRLHYQIVDTRNRDENGQIVAIEDMTARRSFTLDRTPKNNAHGPCSPGAFAEPPLELDAVDVEWSCDGGFPPDTMEMPVVQSHINTFMGQLIKKSQEQGIIGLEQGKAMWKLTREIVKPAEGSDDVGIITVIVNTREVIRDQINVPHGAGIESIVMLLEQKKLQLAKSLGIS